MVINIIPERKALLEEEKRVVRNNRHCYIPVFFLLMVCLWFSIASCERKAENPPPETQAVTSPIPADITPWLNFRNDSQHTGYSRYNGPDRASFSWHYRTGNEVNSSAVQDMNGFIYAGSDDFNLYCLDREGMLKWK